VEGFSSSVHGADGMERANPHSPFLSPLFRLLKDKSSKEEGGKVRNPLYSTAS
jgi:hypothetical protein